MIATHIANIAHIKRFSSKEGESRSKDAGIGIFVFCVSLAILLEFEEL